MTLPSPPRSIARPAPTGLLDAPLPPEVLAVLVPTAFVGDEDETAATWGASGPQGALALLGGQGAPYLAAVPR
mgnify:CR=1 FL=1